VPLLQRGSTRWRAQSESVLAGCGSASISDRAAERDPHPAVRLVEGAREGQLPAGADEGACPARYRGRSRERDACAASGGTSMRVSCAEPERPSRACKHRPAAEGQAGLTGKAAAPGAAELSPPYRAASPSHGRAARGACAAGLTAPVAGVAGAEVMTPSLGAAGSCDRVGRRSDECNNCAKCRECRTQQYVRPGPSQRSHARTVSRT
jgi:hypothetical protein